MSSAIQWYQPAVLNELAMRWSNEEFIADRIFPMVPVPQKKFRYLLVDNDITYRIQDDTMAPYASANEIDIKGSLVDGVITDKALKTPIDEDETEQNPGLAIEAMKTNSLMDSMALARENRAATILRATGTYPGANSTTLTGTSKWSDPASDPKAAILAVKDSLLKPNGAKAVLWMGETVYTALQLHPKVAAAIQYTNSGSVDTRPILAQYLQVDEIVVGKALYATNKYGQALATARIWGTDAGLVYVNPRAPQGLMREPTFGAFAVLRRSGNRMFQIFRSLDATRGTGQGLTWLKSEGTYDLLIQANQLGYLWKTAA
jgi:hypothetical protein